MKLLEISSQDGSGIITGIAKLNHSISHLVRMLKNIQFRNESEALKATLFRGEENLGEYPIVTTQVMDAGEEEGTINGKIDLERGQEKAQVDIKFNITKDQTTFEAKLVSYKKQS